jgi:hypothetical protein
MVKYVVVNPVMGGTIKTEYEASSAEEAAKQFWETLTVDNKVFMDNLPIFAFTIKGGDKEEFFSVKEKPEGRKNVEYQIDNITNHVMKNTTAEERKQAMEASAKMQRQVKNIQNGGGDEDDKKKKRYKDSSSSSSSSNDLEDVDDYLRYIRKKQYANNYLWYWWYNPSIYRLRNLFTPAFRNV